VSHASDVGPELLDGLQKSLPTMPVWSIREGRSLLWWPCELRQVLTIEEPRTDMGIAVCKLTIRTQLIQDVAIVGKTLDLLAGLNRMACMSALVHDETDRSIALHTSFYVHEGSLGWITRLASFASVAQMAEAQTMVDGLQTLLCESGGSGDKAASAHPVKGVRTQVDDMRAVIGGLRKGAVGMPPSYGLEDFQESTDSYGPDPSLMTNFDEGGLTAEFQFHGQAPAAARLVARMLGQRPPGFGSALFQADVKARHPSYGSGCLTLLALPVSDTDPQLVNRLNLQERDDWTRAQGIGAWCLGDKGITHAAFLPAAVRRPGTFGMIYRNAALRSAWAGRFLS